MSKPIRWIDRLLDWYCDPMYVNEIKGDLHELSEQWIDEKGSRYGKAYYILNALLFLRFYNSKFTQNNRRMFQGSIFKHFLKVSFRSLQKNSNYSITNIVGLTLGIAISLLIYFHIQKELSFDKSYPKHDRIYRISTHHEWAKSSPSLGPEMAAFFPELESVGRFARYGGNVAIISYEDKQVASSDIFHVDHSVLDIFDLNVKVGDVNSSLLRPFTAVLTSTCAQKLFGSIDPIGKVVAINGNEEFEITAVIDDLPGNSHLKAEMLISMPTFYEKTPKEWVESKGWMVMYTYALLQRDISEKAFRSKMETFERHYVTEENWYRLETQFFEIMPLTDVHLKSDRIQEMGENSKVMFIYILGTLAIFIILIACVNFINLFTTISLKRTKEIGLRSVVGASRSSLIAQILLEAMLSSLIACTLAFAACMLVLPFYNQYVSISVEAVEILSMKHIVLLLVFGLLLGFVSGIYPALLVTKPSDFGLNRGSLIKTEISFFRKGLIVFQFVLSLSIIIGTLAINSQIKFIEAQSLGFDKEQVVSIKTYGKLNKLLRESRGLLEQKVLSIPGIERMGNVTDIVGESLSVEGFGLASSSEDEHQTVNMIWSDDNYLDVIGTELVAGRNFLPKVDTGATYIINETLATRLGKSVLGEMVVWRGNKGSVIGIVKDFHHYSLHKEIEPMVITHKPEWGSHLMLKMNTSDLRSTMAELEDVINELAPNTLLLYNFIDERLDELYKSENNMLSIVGVFSILALVISCVGLLGMAGLEVQRRTKEIGIRKVLGATNRSILEIISRPFFFILSLVMVIGIPISYLAIDEWLAAFSYRVELTALVFVGPSIALLLLALLVVIFHAYRTVHSNPTESLRCE